MTKKPEEFSVRQPIDTKKKMTYTKKLYTKANQKIRIHDPTKKAQQKRKSLERKLSNISVGSFIKSVNSMTNDNCFEKPQKSPISLLTP